jgi:3-deoxy-D-manno-octulosonate 8-phosphate phosphatase (KDO 8-P phosphatase)
MPLAMAALAERAARIRLAVFDVDGVLTDGRLLLGPDGAEYKAFHVRDGYGLVALRRAGLDIAVISGRTSAVVVARMRELGIVGVHQGIADKGECLAGVLAAAGIPGSATLYVGDDEPDLPAFALVGLPVAVADASPAVRAAAAWVTRARGGQGAVREVCELLLAARPARPASV